MKPSVFVGSSTESLEIAYAFQKELEFLSETTVWSQGVFHLSVSILDNLLETLDNSDFGIFVLSPEDITKIRDTQYLTVRDNVIFELGLFIGRLGKERSFMVIPRNCSSLHLPTDLNGIVPATYDSDRKDKNIQAAIGPACFQIRQNLCKYGKRKYRISESNILQINEPSILCGASSQYVQLGFDRDVEIISSSFSGKPTIEDNLSSERLRDLLLKNEFNIIHLVLFVEPITGDLIFGEIDLKEQKLPSGKVDSLSVEAFQNYYKFQKQIL